MLDPSSNLSLSPIGQYAEKYVIGNETPIETDRHRAMRLTVQVAAVLFIAFGQTAYFNTSRTLAGDATTFDEIYGWWLALCNSGAFGTVDAYTIYQIVNDVIRVISPEEKEILAVGGARMIDLAIRGVSFVTAMFAVVPHMDMGARYNKHSALVATLAAMTDIWIPTLSIKLSIDDLRGRVGLSEFEKQLREHRGNVIGLIDEFNSAALDNPGHFGQLEGVERIEDLMRVIVLHEGSITDDPSALRELGLRMTQLTGAFLALSVIAYMGKIGYNFGAYLSGDSIAFSLLVGLFVAACNGYLLSSFIVDASTDFYNFSANALKGDFPKTYGSKYMPKLTLASKALALVTSAFAYGPTVQLAKDNFDGAAEVYMEVVGSIAFFLVCASLTLGFADEGMNRVVGRFGEEEERELVRTSEKLKDFSRLLKGSPLSEYAKFLNDLPDEVFENLGKITRDELDEYLGERQPFIEEIQA